MTAGASRPVCPAWCANAGTGDAHEWWSPTELVVTHRAVLASGDGWSIEVTTAHDASGMDALEVELQGNLYTQDPDALARCAAALERAAALVREQREAEGEAS